MRFFFFFFVDANHCGGLKSCVRCDKGGGTVTLTQHKNASTKDNGSYRCLKCIHLIVFRTRECVEKCPLGYSEEWSTLVDYMGRICKGKKKGNVHDFLQTLSFSQKIIFCLSNFRKYNRSRRTNVRPKIGYSFRSQYRYSSLFIDSRFWYNLFKVSTKKNIK